MSNEVIDGRLHPREIGPLNCINHELSEINSSLAVLEALSQHGIEDRRGTGSV